MVANAWLEGTYTERYPHISQDGAGMGRLFRQFSFPGGIPSHCRARDPRLDPRGRRARVLAGPRLRRRLRQPGPGGGLRGRRRGGRDRTGGHRLALQQVPRPPPGRGGAADPAPERLQDRRPDGARPDPDGRAAGPVHRLRLRPGRGGGGFDGEDPMAVHRPHGRRPGRRRWTEIADIQDSGPGAGGGRAGRRGRCSSCAPPRAGPGPRWSTGCRSRGRSGPTRSPWPRSGPTPSTWPCSTPGCAATGPRSSSTTTGGRCARSLAARPPAGDRRMSANPHANGGLLRTDLELPDFRDYAVAVPCPGPTHRRGHRVLGRVPA